MQVHVILSSTTPVTATNTFVPLIIKVESKPAIDKPVYDVCTIPEIVTTPDIFW